MSLSNQIDKYITIPSDNFIWSEIITSKLPTLVVPGDHFLFNTYSKDFEKEVGVRDMTVNTFHDFEDLKTQYPNLELVKSPEPYFPYHSIWSLPPILSILQSHNKRLIMRKSSVITPQLLDEYNIIFIGSIKTLYSLEHIVSRSHFQYSIEPHSITYTDPDSNISRSYTTKRHSVGPNEDLVLALKMPGPVNNSIFVIASFHSLGAPEIAKYFTTPGLIEEFKSMLLERDDKLPKYFEILFRVTGIDKTAYKTEILEYRAIEEGEPGTGSANAK